MKGNCLLKFAKQKMTYGWGPNGDVLLFTDEGPSLTMSEAAQAMARNGRLADADNYLQEVDAKHAPGIGGYLDRYKNVGIGLGIGGTMLYKGLKSNNPLLSFASVPAGALASYISDFPLTENYKLRKAVRKDINAQDDAAMAKILTNPKFEDEALSAARDIELIGKSDIDARLGRHASKFGIPSKYKRNVNL